MKRDLDIAVIGGGAFGTTLASLLAEIGRKVVLWVREEGLARAISRRHVNDLFLPGFRLPRGLRATTDLHGLVPRAPVVLIVVPSEYFRGVARAVGEVIEGDQVLVHATKGIEVATFQRMSEVLREETCALKVGVLSGPNLSGEIMAGKPAGAVIASRYDEVVATVQALFSGSRLRTYGGRDVTGVEVGGSFKNIIALAAGAVDALGMGDNAKALLLTRGLGEMARFGVALGSDVFTFLGLAGLGDLMATCGSRLSRNYRFGERLAAGETPERIRADMTNVAEGVPTAAAVYRQAVGLGLDLHIVRAVHAVLYEGWTVPEALAWLQSNPAGHDVEALRVR